LAVQKEREFELEIRVVIGGFGKQQHWEVLGRDVKRVLAQRLGDCMVSVERVRLLLPEGAGNWYPAEIGVVPEPEGEWEIGE
jgi:hypothetical protein